MKRITRLALTLSLLATLVQVPGAQAAQVITLGDTDALAFVKSNAVVIAGGATLANAGKAANDIVLYKNVGVFGGTAIDAAVTTVAIGSGSISDYDNPGSASTASGYLNNWQINTVGGNATFKFEFFKAGTYTGVNTGIPVILQNVKVTSIDLDSSGTNGFQYSDFTGFQKYSMMSPTNLGVQQLSNPNRVRFIATKTGARSSVPEDQVLIRYDNLQTMQITFGNVVDGQTNYFGLVFGGWPGTGTPVEYPNVFNAPPVSTNTTLTVLDTTTAAAFTIVPLSAFGNYSDADNNPFYQVKIAAVSSGTLQLFDGTTWNNVSAGTLIPIGSIENGWVRYNPSGWSGTPTITFYVHDGLDFSTNSYTITLSKVSLGQVITFPDPGTRSLSSGPLVNPSTVDSGLTETLTSLTPGVCRIAANGQDIEYITAGTCSVIATQPGNGTYSAAEPKTITFQIISGTVGASSQTITFTLPANKPLSGGTFSPLTGDTASSGLDVTLTSLTPDICTVTNPGSVITPLKVGACVIEATQGGDGTYAPATKVTRTVNITESASGGSAPQIQTLGAVVNNSSSTLNGTSGNKATLNGYVDLNGVTTVVWKMCYARPSSAPSSSTLILPKTSTGYWCVNATPSNTDSSTGTSATTSDYVSATLDVVDSNSNNNIQLKYDTTYYYQIVGWDAANSSDVLYGAIMSFKTKTYYIATNAASSVGTTTATLNGYFKNSSSKSSYTAYYCLTDMYKVNSFQVLVNTAGKCDLVNNPSSANISKGNTGSPVGSVTGLKPGTVYYYQIYVIRSGSKTPSYYGNIVRFKTGEPDPVATTLAATSLGAANATINGSVLANSATTSTVTFCFSSTSTVNGSGVMNNCSGGSEVSATPSTVTGMSGKSVSASVTGLTAGTTYYFQTKAVRSGGNTVYGTVKSFTIGAPTVTTLAPTSVKISSGVSTWEATLNGFLNPNGTSSNPRFCWGTSPTVNAMDSMTACSTIAITGAQETLTSLASYSYTLTGLTGSTKYYYQAYGVNNVLNPALYNYGEVKSFVTAAEPVVTTLAATTVSSDSATVNGTINPSGALTNGTFCISDSSDNTINTGVLDSCLFLVISNPDSMTGSTVTSINAIVNGLSQATTYYFQAIGENERGTVYGEILNFTTAAGAPEATTEAPTAVRGTSATLNGFVNPGGAPTQAYFCFATSSSLDGNGNLQTCASLTDTVTVNATAGLMPITFNKTGLTNNTTYYYQTIALNTVNGVTTTVYGDVVSFRTGVPEVVTLPVTDMAAGVVSTLNGTVASNGDTVTAISFILSASNLVDALGSLDTTTVLAATPTTVNGGLATAQSESYTASSLSLGTTYFYQIRATNSRGTAYGKVLSFVAYAPVAITRPATAVASRTARLNGGVNPTYDLGATGKFCLSDASTVESTGKLSTCLQLVDATPGTFPNSADSATANAMLADVSSLSAGNTYFFQAIANGTNGTNYGEVLSFTTGYSVTFLANDGTNSSTSQAGTSAAALNTNTFTRSGYTFGGWATSAGGSLAYADGASYPFTSNITLYAIWTASAPAPVITPPKTNPTINWNNPAPITFGTPLSGTQLNSIFSVPGTCVYTPPAGTILAAGTHTLSVTCTPTDGNLYNPMTTTVTIVVKKAKGKPSIIWFNPNPIYNPTPLTGTQLNAAASVLGTYRYDPAEGTILPPGTHILNVHFIPKNQDDEEELDARVTILVKEKPANVPNPNTPVAPPSVKDPEAPKKPVLPPAPTVIPAADAKPVMQTAGVKAETVVIPYEDKSGYVIKAPDWTLGIRSTTQFVQGNANESLSKITIEKGNNVTTSGTGFKPNSQVDLYAFSTPIWLGSTITDALGNFSATVPMPDGLPVGDHTFQVNGLTPDEKTRTAAVPITLVPASVAAPKTGGLNFSIYYKMDSFFLYDADKATIAKYVKAIKAKTTSKSKITVEIIGWVQPTVISPHIQYLSQGRAKAIGNYMRKLGLKATYTFVTPGHDKLNIASSRRGEVTVKWTYAK